MRRFAIGAILGAWGCLSVTGGAVAQESADTYPSRNITMIVPIAPGGPTDLVARLIGEHMATTLGKAVVIENRPGGGTSIAASATARSAPDGYTLLTAEISLTVMPLVIANLSYDPLKDLKPVGLTARSVLTLVVNPALPLKNARDLVDFAHAHPDEIKAAHPGIGTAPHLATLALMQSSNSRLTLVSYRGAALATQDVIAGHISMLMTTPSITIELTRSGKLRMLGVTGARRLSALPEVPTLAEQGIDIDGLEDGVWFGIVAPAGVRSDIVAKLNGAIQAAVMDPAVRDKMALVDMTAASSTPESFGQLIERQSKVWAKTLQRAGIKAE